MSPPAIGETPAVRRRSTVLPEPDGPRMASVSPRSTTAKASVITARRPKDLETWSRTRNDMAASSSSLDRAEGQPFDEVALREEGEDQRRHDREHQRGRDLPVLDTGCRDEGERAHRHRLLVRGREDQREDEVVPREDEREEHRSGDPWTGKRDGD